ncbi:MAG TPA: fibronectin type III domain-containing protein [Verrucomicrobiae bacterium]|nr:fibronectin type III domain-containing protein [Verrucomicrobiae bacterium]
MKKLLVLCGVVAAHFTTQTLLAADAELFVSPTGNDDNPGTRARPIRTLQHARDLVRAMDQNMTGDITVWLAGGTFRLNEPLTLDAEDSGTGGHDVIYAGMPGQHPIISGGVAVTGWKLVDARRNLWSAPAPAALKNTRQLYVDGVRAERTQGRLPVKLTETPTGYIAGSPEMASWRNPSDIEFVYTGGNGIWSEHSWGLGAWTEPRCPVASIEGTTITMAEPCWDNSTKRVPLPPDIGFKRPANLVGPASVGKQPEYVENAYELLGTPGQFYFDRAAKVIYYVPRPGEDLATADVEAPVLQKLISGEGTEDAPVHNIIFKGLQFSHATWLFPCSDEGFSEIQANYMVTGPDGYATQGLGDLVPNGQKPFGDWTKTPGNVSFSYDHQIQFLGDDFVHLGGAGLELGDGSQSDKVEGCIFTDVSANGLELGGVDLPEGNATEVTRDNQILDNHIYNVAAEFHGGIGIDVGYAQNTLIAHNQLDHLPYTAISMGWGGWPDKIHRAGVANNSHDNRVEDNLIFDHMQLLADGGGIYTQGLTGPSLAEGEKLIGNVIYDQFGTGHGIYTDNGCNNVTAKSNVIFHTDHDNWGGRHRNYYDDNDGKVFDYFDFEDNYWQQGDPDRSAENVTLKNNHIISRLDQAPEAILQHAGLQPEFKSILKEQLGAPAAPEPPSRVAAFAGNGFALVAWNPSVFDGGTPVKSYTVISSEGDKVTVSIGEFNKEGYVKISGLSNGKDYTFSVTANNANGSSSPSLPSESVTPNDRPVHPPAAPSMASVSPGDGMATIHFDAPENDGGSPVLAFAVMVNPGGRKVMFTGRPVLVLGGRHVTFGVVDGLENGKTYTFEVAAVNVAGGGPAKATRPITLAAASAAE